jgi:hypothetical protein
VNALRVKFDKSLIPKGLAAMPASPKTDNIYQLKITLLQSRPPIWRRILIPASSTLARLHNVIQIVMDWDGDHLHCFNAKNNVQVLGLYGEKPDLSERDENKTYLRTAFAKEKTSITYTYDFGAWWEHKITLEKILPHDPTKVYPVVITGKRNSPIEDGGDWDEDDDDEYGGLPEGYDPAFCDIETMNSRLSKRYTANN